MFETFGNLFGRKPAGKGGPLIREPKPETQAPRSDAAPRGQTFSKIFRWRLPDGQTEAPGIVEVVGSFTHWQKVPLHRDSAMDSWHVAMHHIQGNKTHHYMLLVDGKPTYDKTCDGLAVPRGADEEKYQVATDKGPRVMMLFAQTK
jgi:hypothetical protein